ncbi:Mobile element protein [Pseudomonas chlororaphis subsp. piscium]|nr:Mobile element protein [Pseudomonas chlororaphis subsp. piscium]
MYFNSLDKAAVLCRDEKSQAQALEHTRSGLPLAIGDIHAQLHDYIRHSIVTLLTALDYLRGDQLH